MPDSDILTLAETLRPALLRLSRQLRRESQRLGLSPLDAMLLGLIHKRAGIGVSELAELEMISKPTMSASSNAWKPTVGSNASLRPTTIAAGSASPSPPPPPRPSTPCVASAATGWPGGSRR